MQFSKHVSMPPCVPFDSLNSLLRYFDLKWLEDVGLTLKADPAVIGYNCFAQVLFNNLTIGKTYLLVSKRLSPSYKIPYLSKATKTKTT